MKRILLISIALFLISGFGLVNKVNVAKAENNPFPPVKGLFIDVGGGGLGASAALGFRYSFASLSVGIIGFANSIPNYSVTPPQGVYFNPNEPLPSGYVSEEHNGITVTFDAGFHYEYFPWTFFANVGYFTQQDSVLAKEIRSDGRSPNRYSWKVNNTSGISFGGGGNYSITDNIALGLGIHTKRGLYAQFMYVW